MASPFTVTGTGSDAEETRRGLTQSTSRFEERKKNREARETFRSAGLRLPDSFGGGEETPEAQIQFDEPIGPDEPTSQPASAQPNQASKPPKAVETSDQAREQTQANQERLGSISETLGNIDDILGQMRQQDNQTEQEEQQQDQQRVLQEQQKEQQQTEAGEQPEMAGGVTVSQAMQDQFDAINQSTKQHKDRLTQLSANMDATAKAMINNIKKRFDQRRREAKSITETNIKTSRTLGIVSGRSRYAPERQADIITAEEERGLERLEEIDAKEQQLILEAQTANQENQFAVLQEKMNQIDQAQQQKLNILKTQNQMAVKQNQIAIDRAREERQQQKFAFDVQQSIQDQTRKQEEQQIEQLNKAGIAVVGGEMTPTLQAKKEQRIASLQSIDVHVNKNGAVTGIDKRTGQPLWQTESGVGSARDNSLRIETITDPQSGQLQAIQRINQDTGQVEFISPNGERLDPSQVQVEQPDPDAAINQLIMDALQSSVSSGETSMNQLQEQGYLINE